MKPPVWTLTPERYRAALAYLRGLARGDLARFEAAMPPALAEPHADAVALLDSLAMQGDPPAAPAGAKVIPLRPRCETGGGVGDTQKAAKGIAALARASEPFSDSPPPPVVGTATQRAAALLNRNDEDDEDEP